MKSFCVSMPEDVHEWLRAEARKRGCSVSHLVSTLAARERDVRTMDEIEALKKRLAAVELYAGELAGRYG